MQQITEKSILCIKDRFEFEYHVAELFYIINKDNTYEFRLYPNYDVIDLLPSDQVFSIKGINLDIKKDCYIRHNMIPSAIEEYLPLEGYASNFEELEMGFPSILSFLMNHHSGNHLYLIPYESKKDVVFNFKDEKRNNTYHIKRIIEQLAKGNDVIINDLVVDSSNKKSIYALMLSLYENSYNYQLRQIKLGVSKAKVDNKYRGRKQLPIESTKLDRVMLSFINNDIDFTKAAEELKISLSTFYRRLKQYKKDNGIN